MTATKKYTREALGEKYTTPFTGASAGKNVVLNELAKFLNRAETGMWANPLFDAEAIGEATMTVHTERERDMYNRYIYLAQWTAHYDHAVRSYADTARALCFYHLEMLSNTVKSEMIEHDMTLYPSSNLVDGKPRFQEKPMSDLASSLLTASDLTRFNEGNSDRFNITRTWSDIRSTLDFCRAYNTAIELIAKAIAIPEYKAYRLNLSVIEKLLTVMREHVATLDGIVYDTNTGEETELSNKVYGGVFYEGEAFLNRAEALTLLHSLYDAAEEPISEEAIASAKKQLHRLSAFANGIGNELIDTLRTIK